MQRKLTLVLYFYEIHLQYIALPMAKTTKRLIGDLNP